VQARLAELSIPVRVRPGAEIALTYALDLSDRELRALSLGGGPWLLIELPQASAVVGLEAQLKHLQDRGHGIVIAHVERCPSFAHDSELLGRLVEAGMIASLTAGALVGRFGAPLQRFAQRLVARGLVHNVASDAHDCALRAPGLRHELAAANLREQTAWLTQDVPAAILAGRPIPPMPPNWPAAPSRSQLLGRLLTTRH
jgi:protein-tyrosine phosphatase